MVYGCDPSSKNKSHRKQQVKITNSNNRQKVADINDNEHNDSGASLFSMSGKAKMG